MTTVLEPPVYDGQGRYSSYVPRLLIQWIRESPKTRYRAVDGSLTFVDILGLSPLTERLALQGQDSLPVGFDRCNVEPLAQSSQSAPVGSLTV